MRMPRSDTAVLCFLILILWIGQAYNYRQMRRLTCEHAWVQGPYMIRAVGGSTAWIADPTLPSTKTALLTNDVLALLTTTITITNNSFIWVEHCLKCGLVRLDERYRHETGHYLPRPLPPTGLRVVPDAEQ